MSKKDYGQAAGGTVGVGLYISRMVDGKSTIIKDRKPESRMEIIKNRDIETIRMKLAKAVDSLAKAEAKARETAKKHGQRFKVTKGIIDTRDMIALYKRIIEQWERGE